jgi:hypothetical protein
MREPVARRVRTYRPEDRAAFFGLVESVWGREVADRLNTLWDWRLRAPGWPGQPEALLLDEGGAIGGALNLFPALLQTPAGVVPAAWGGEFVVGERHRGKGLLLLKRVLELPNPFLGAPNELSRPILERFGFRNVCTLENRIQIVRPRRLVARVAGSRVAGAAAGLLWEAGRRALRTLRAPARRGVTVSRVGRFDARFDDLWRRVGPAHGILVVRDAAYLNWRFTERPDCTYEIAAAERSGRVAGYVVYYPRQREGLLHGQIVDFLVDREDRDARDALFAHASRALERTGVDLTTCYVPPHEAFYREGLRRCGFWIGRAKQPVLVTDPHAALAPGCLEAREWFFTRGDSDLDFN